MNHREIVYTGIMNDKRVRYTLVRYRNERHEQRGACKFDRNIFVAMVEQSRDSVARLNVMSDLSQIRCRSICHDACSAPCSEKPSQFNFADFSFSLFRSIHTSTYIFIISLEIQSKKRQ